MTTIGSTTTSSPQIASNACVNDPNPREVDSPVATQDCRQFDDPYGQDVFEYASPHEKALAKAQDPWHQAPADTYKEPALSPRELMAQRATPAVTQQRHDEPTQKLQDQLLKKITDPAIFTAETFQSTRALGAQLNVSVFDKLGSSADPKTGANPMILGCKGLLEDKAALRDKLESSLTHLPAADRGPAADAIIQKLEDKLCGVIQSDTAKIVTAQVEVAKGKISPFCAKDSPERVQLAAGLVNAQPPLSETAISKRLEKVGIPPSEASDIAAQLVNVRQDPALVAQLNAGLKGDKSGEGWHKGVVYDGALKNLDEALQDGFKENMRGLNRVATQVGNDNARGDAMFTSPLAEQALKHVLNANGINPSEKATSGADQLIHERTQSRSNREFAEGLACSTILMLASLTAPGMGTLAGMALSGMSAAPGIMISQDRYDAAEAGQFAGTNSAETAADARSKRNLEVGMGVLGIALAGVGGQVAGKFKDARLLNDVDDAVKALHSDKIALHTHALIDGVPATLGLVTVEGLKYKGNQDIDETTQTQPEDVTVAGLQGERRIMP